MEYYEIEGGYPLEGTVRVSGAKNAVLPLLAASLLTDKEVIVSNVPRVRDTFTMLKLLEIIGTEYTWDDEHTLRLRTHTIKNPVAPYEVVSQMRASIYVLAPLLVREKFAKVSLPGGCAFGPRPVDFHIEGLKTLGTHIEIEEGYIIGNLRNPRGGHIKFPKSSVGATAQMMMLASSIPEETIIEPAAMEPEITQLGNFLQKLGVHVEGLGTERIKIIGVREFRGENITIKVIPDRIEIGTFMVMGAITRGKITIDGYKTSLIPTFYEKLEEIGVNIKESEERIQVEVTDSPLRGVDIETAPFPGFPTDLQPPIMSLLSIARGNSTIIETIYPDRFKHAFELVRMGANIKVDMNKALIKGVETLKGADVMASDLRGGACLVIAGLAAKGKTRVHRVYHIQRGYENFPEKLLSLGAKVKILKE